MPGRRPQPVLRKALLDSALAKGVGAGLDALWRLCADARTAVALWALVALAAALGLALPQAPQAAAGEQAAFGRWLADLQMRRGPWVLWPARLGLLSLFAAPGLRWLWAAVAVAALVAAADRLLAWRARAVARFPWAALAHLGLILVLAGAVVDERWGWQQEQLLVGSGRPVAVGGGLFLDRASDSSSAAVALDWQRGDSAGRLQLQPGRPAHVGLVTVHLAQTGPAVRLRVLDAADRVLPVDDPSLGGPLLPEATLRFQKAGESRYVSVPGREWLVRVAYQPTADGEPVFVLWVYRGLEAAPLAQADLQGSGEVEVGETRLCWQVEPYVSLWAACQPGLVLWAAGWVLLCCGLGAAVLTLPAAAGRLRSVLWMVVTTGLAVPLWLVGTRLWPTGMALPARVALPFLVWAAAALLLAATAALLQALGCEATLIGLWPQALGWSALAWMVGGGPAALTHWLAGGTLWRWTTAQLWWALPACLLWMVWHRRTARAGWTALAVSLAAVAATTAAFVAPAAGL